MPSLFKRFIKVFFISLMMAISSRGHAMEGWQEICVIPNMGVSLHSGQLNSPVDLAFEKSNQALLLDPNIMHF